MRDDATERRIAGSAHDGFDEFVVHPGNREAYEACLAVAEGRWSGKTPITLRGPLGCGKSHLLKAVETRRRVTGAGTTVATLGPKEVGAIATDGVFLGDTLLPPSRKDAGLLLVKGMNLNSWPNGVQLWLAGALLRLRDTGGHAVLIQDGVDHWNPTRGSAMQKLVASGRIIHITYPGASARREMLERWFQRWGATPSEEVLAEMARRLPGSGFDLVVAAALVFRRMHEEKGSFPLKWVEEILAKTLAPPSPEEGRSWRQRVEEILTQEEEREEANLRIPIPRTH